MAESDSTSAVQTAVDVLILVSTTAFTLYALCHTLAMWEMRKQFVIALRSPRLGCLYGALATLRSLQLTYTLVLYDFTGADGLFKLTGLPAVLELFGSPATVVGIGALVGLAFRLLVLYEPSKMKKWKPFVKEKTIVHALWWAFFVMEVVMWALVSVYGLDSTTAVVMYTLEPAGFCIVAVVSPFLGFRLRRMKTTVSLARDTFRLGVWMIANLFFIVAISVVPLPMTAYKYSATTMVILWFQPIVWTLNVKPVQEFLREKSAGDKRTLWSWILPGKVGDIKNNPRVACTASEGMKNDTRVHSNFTSRFERPLAVIIGFAPLEEAFGEFCRKALCNESFQFLIEVSEFQNMVHATNGSGGSDGGYEKYVAISKEYIKDNSNSEVNISSKTKEEVLAFSERSAYTSLDTV